MSFFFFNDTATTEIYTLSLHDALPISDRRARRRRVRPLDPAHAGRPPATRGRRPHDRAAGEGRAEADVDRLLPRRRSEEHTSELQSRQYLVCRLLLEKKKKKRMNYELA